MSEEKKHASPDGLSWEKEYVLQERNAVRERKKVTADWKDQVFALIYLLVGFGFIYTFTEWNFERHLAVFTVCYAAVVWAYLFFKRRKPAPESWFWAVVMLGIGVSYAFWSAMPFLQVCVLIAVAAYWTLSAAGRFLEDGKTSHWVVFDLWNALVIIPFYNFTCQVRTLLGGDRKEAEAGNEKDKKKEILGIGLGIGLAVPILMVILPLLSSADAGFARIVTSFTKYLTNNLMVTILRILFSIPVSMYLFGLIYGGISGRNTDRIEKSRIREMGKEVRFLPNLTVYTAEGIVCMVYVLFIWLQGKYLFSAFAGIRPEGFTYAEYARQGFFELCAIAALNLVILLAAGIFSKTAQEENPGLRILNVLLSVLTLLLITTAMSKMVMYISVYGLTVKRVLTMVFMIWMAVVFVLGIMRQWRAFPMVRICVMVGAVLFLIICVLPVEHWTAACNFWARNAGMIL